MIELAEAYTYAKQLKKELKGKKVVDVIVKASPHNFAFINENIDYKKQLKGSVLEDCYNIAGIIEMKFNNAYLTMRDGANIKIYDNKDKLPKKHQLLIEFEGNEYLIVTVQMYAEIFLDEHVNNGNYYYQIAKDRLNPLHKEFTLEYFKSILRECEEKESIKAILTTKQRFPGIGNGSLQDILFKAKINPKTKLKVLSDKQINRLYDVLMETITDMSQKDGRDTEKDIYGNAGNYKTILSTKTYKDGCPICNGEIVKTAFLGGNVYYCPVCQPIIK